VLINLVLAVRVLGLGRVLEELVAEAEEIGDISSDNRDGKAVKGQLGLAVKR
jgi:hypothetical protein